MQTTGFDLSTVKLFLSTSFGEKFGEKNRYNQQPILTMCCSCVNLDLKLLLGFQANQNIHQNTLVIVYFHRMITVVIKKQRSFSSHSCCCAKNKFFVIALVHFLYFTFLLDRRGCGRALECNSRASDG